MTATSEQLELPIVGMTCASRVERTLNSKSPRLRRFRASHT